MDASRKASLKDYFVVSADSHVNEPNDLWATRIDRRFKDRVPRVEVDAQGRKWFTIEGFRPSRIREAPRDQEVSVEAFRSENDTNDARPQLDRTKGAMFQQRGAPPGADRSADMDYDGIDAEIVFPNKGLTCWSSPDPEHNTAMCRVWNDWAHEAFAGQTRSYPVAAIAPADLASAVAEVQRVATLGFHAVMMPPLLRGKGYNMPDFDPLWAALCDARLPVCFHAGSGKDPRTAAGDGGAIINYVVHAMNTVLEPVVQLCSSGVLERFPTLYFATIEAGAGWVPYALWGMDQGFDKHAFWVAPKLKMKPSEYFRRNGHASFQEDPIGVQLVEEMGIGTMLWGNDYPHLEGSWPYSGEVTDRMFAGLKRSDRAAILGLNAARLFNIDVPEKFRRA
jgi:predicted TIM-barrel fold metal-dependent hydrolase